MDPQFGNEQAYRRKVYFVAQDVAAVVQQLEKPAAAGYALAARQQQESIPVVYLAECSYDCAEEGRKLRDEVRANGYTVLPEPGAHLPDLDVEYVAEVTRLLSQCELSVHLIGISPGKVPDGKSGKSAVQLQNEVAARRSAARHLQRIIWMAPRNLSDRPGSHSTFVDLLTRDSELQKGAELIVGDVEELKAAVRASLQKLAELKKLPGEPAEATGGIYVICLEDDLDAISPLTDLLSRNERPVDLPVFSGKAAQVRQANEALAMNCDAVIVFCGAGDGAWMFHQQNELKRIAGLRRDKPWRAHFTLLAGPATPDKKAMLVKKPPGLVNIMDGFAPEKMQLLLDALRGS